MALEDNIKKMVESLGLTLYDTVTIKENNELIYRVVIHSKEGVSLDQCTEVTKLLSPLLDVEPPVSGNYRLEVSSPGIERKLTKLYHFALSLDEKVKIKTIKEKLTVTGVLKSVDDELLSIEDDNGERHEVTFKDVSSAKTYFEWV